MPSESYTSPGWNLFVLPERVDSFTVDMKGAGSTPARGGRVTGTVHAPPGTQFHIFVGQEGKPHTDRIPGGGTLGNGGAGGRGRGTGNGGNSGGGATYLVQDSQTGWIRAIAASAGGSSGDGGDGGDGGGREGAPGKRGSAGSGGTRNPTGGSQVIGGAGGKNQTAAPTFDGVDAVGGFGADGGTVPDGNSHGGGGGGAGWRGGGSGNASGGSSPATGGAGGSNYSDGIIATTTVRGTGGTGNGSVDVSWVTPPALNLTPPPPSDLQINGIDIGSDTSTKVVGAAFFTANISNPDGRESVTLVIRIVKADDDPATQEWNFTTFSTHVSGPLSSTLTGDPVRGIVRVDGLDPNTKYYVRAYSLDSTGLWSVGQSDQDQANGTGGWTGGSFWTNRPPNPPDLLTPYNNNQFEATDNIFFSWTPLDPDDDDKQSKYEMRTRRIARPNETSAYDWVAAASAVTDINSQILEASLFTGNQFYSWSVRTADEAGVWSDWSRPNTFYVESVTMPPAIISPKRETAVVAAQSSIFRWEFLSPDASSQHRADVRVRVVNTADWVTYYGQPDPDQPGSTPEWVFPLGTFILDYHYEWQVRTYNAIEQVSDWSNTETFWAVAQAGEGLAPAYLSPNYETPAPPLGCGVNRVFIFDRGGEVMRGEITNIISLSYGRRRDDITSCSIRIEGYGSDCASLLKTLRSWMHEIVIFRDGIRVWEGPVTRVDTLPGSVEIDAKDVMAYVYRRIMRQGYNDTYRVVNGQKLGGLSVVRRAALITMNALAYDDPNVLRWVTEIAHSDDAKEYRSVPDFSKTAWEEIDDLAATGGLDYTVLGRRILYWDTHRPLGRLPEMRDEHFSEPVHVTEYGMQLSNFFAVTSNTTVYGVATRGLSDVPGEKPLYYGWVEQLVSAYGETEGDEVGVVTDESRIVLEEGLAKQAERGIAHRWPTPLIVRVPDNATISPDVNLGFDQLVPGVWIPIRAEGTLREVSQWQKLDSVSVTVTPETGEQIGLTMSPAPNEGEDTDADSSALEDG